MSEAPPCSPRRVRLAWKIALVLAPFVGLAVLLSVERFRGIRALEEWRAAAEARGEPLVLAQMELPEPSAAGRMAEVTAACDALKAKSKGKVLVVGNWQAMKRVAPGVAESLCAAPLLGEAGSWDDLGAELKALSPELEVVRELLREPVSSATNHSDLNAPFRIATSFQFAAACVYADALHSIHDGQYDGALADLVAARSVALSLRNEGGIVPQVLSFGVSAFAILPAVWEGLEQEGWLQEQLARLDGALPNGFADAYVKAMLIERFRLSLFYDAGRKSPHAIGLMAPEEDNLPPWMPAELSGVILSIRARIWAFAWSHQDELRANRLLTESIDAARNYAATHDGIATKRLIPEHQSPSNTYDRTRYRLSELVLPAFESVLKSLIKIETQIALSRAAIGLKRFHLATGEYPESLAELVPTYLPHVPIDHCNGRPLRYRRDSEELFTLYSVGENGTDDGGDPSPRAESDDSGTWSGEDAVWPRAAPAPHDATARSIP